MAIFRDGVAPGIWIAVHEPKLTAGMSQNKDTDT